MKSKEGAKVQPMFQIIDGSEKYKVIDLVTGGETFFTEKVHAYRMMAFIADRLQHNYRLEVR
jgi:hypothetical protein